MGDLICLLATVRTLNSRLQYTIACGEKSTQLWPLQALAPVESEIAESAMQTQITMTINVLFERSNKMRSIEHV